MILSHAAPVPRPRLPAAPAVHARSQPTYRAQLATTERTRRDAYRIRHDSYAAGGHISPRPDGLFSDGYDAKSNAHTIVVYANAIPIASVRVCLLVAGNAAAVPVQAIFPEIVDRLVRQCATGRERFQAAEVNRLVRSPQFSDDIKLVFFLYKLAGVLLVRNDVQLILSCARKNHVAFYRRLKFQEVSGPMVYPGLTCPMHMLALRRNDYDDVRSSLPPLDPESVAPAAFDDFIGGHAIDLH